MSATVTTYTAEQQAQNRQMLIDAYKRDGVDGLNKILKEQFDYKLDASDAADAARVLAVVKQRVTEQDSTQCEAYDPMPLFPSFAKTFPNWVTYIDGTKQGKAPRISGTANFAKSDDPSTWVSYSAACENIAKGLGYKNLGFVTNGEQAGFLTGIDIDGGKTASGVQVWVTKVLEIIARIAGSTYIEWTPNGGLRAWVRGDFTKHGRRTKYKMAADAGWNDKAQQVEVFDDGLYFTTTGNRMSDTSEVALLDDTKTLALLDELAKMSIEDPMLGAKKKVSGEFDPAFAELFAQVGWTPLEERMNKMDDPRYHGLTIEDGKLTYCPMPEHGPRNLNVPYSRCFGVIPGSNVLHCFGCGWSGDVVKAVRDFDGAAAYPTMTDCARAICTEQGLDPLAMFPDTGLKLNQKPDAGSPAAQETAQVANVPLLLLPGDDDDPTWQYAITSEAYEAEMEKDYPVIPCKLVFGPTWDDDIMYGVAGDIVRKAAEYNEAHPAGMYLDLLVSFGSIVGRNPYFNVNSTRHYANEFVVRVGESSLSRKGTGRDAVNEVLELIDPNWYHTRVRSGFGSAEAIVNEVRDDAQQQVRRRKTNTFDSIVVPGVKDKRLMIREGELASVFQLAGKPESRADVVLRDGWDSKPLHNIVKGKSDGLSNSNSCQFPHISLSADTTRGELIAKMPKGAESNGFGNRFLYPYVHRVKLCPNGGPPIDWAPELQRVHKALSFARDLGYISMQDAARKLWNRMYADIEKEQASLPGQAASMTSRAPAHVRRLALILCLLDDHDCIETHHLRAAKRIWDYCQDSARYIFGGLTRDQQHILDWLLRTGPATVPQIRENLFKRNRKADWVRLQVNGLIGANRVELKGDKISVKA